MHPGRKGKKKRKRKRKKERDKVQWQKSNKEHMEGGEQFKYESLKWRQTIAPLQKVFLIMKREANN